MIALIGIEQKRHGKSNKPQASIVATKRNQRKSVKTKDCTRFQMATKRTKKRQRPIYDDQFRASAVVMLESQGYPEIKGALTIVANHLHVPPRTLSRWFNSEQNPPPVQLVKEKRGDLVEGIKNELDAILQQMVHDRKDAEYKDLAWTFGVFVDKLQLLTGKATDKVEVDVNDSRERLAHLIDRFADRRGTAANIGEIKQ